MATVSRDNVGLLTDKLTVNLTKEDYLPAFEQAIKKYAKQANIPGFRKGMVPTGMIKKMHGAGVFTEEVFRTAEKELQKYIREEKPDILAQPIPLDIDSRRLDMNHPSDYQFAFEIGLKPAINIDVNNITVTRHKVDITEKMVDEEVAKLAEQYSEMTEVEEIASVDNKLNLSFIESAADGNIIANGLFRSETLAVKQFSESVRDQLMGKKKNDFILLRLSNAFAAEEKQRIMQNMNFSDDEEIADRFFTMTIMKVSIEEKPEMSEAFFSRVFPGSGWVHEDDFRKAVKERLQASWNVQSTSQLHDQIYHKLFDETSMELPEKFLKRYIQVADEQSKTAEEAEKEYPSYTNSIKYALITNQLLRQNGISISEEEVRNFAKQQILGYMGGVQSFEDVPWLESYAEKMLQEKKFRQNIRNEVENNKLYDALEQQVNIIEDVVTPEELSAMQHQHRH